MDDSVPEILEQPKQSDSQSRRNWARLIQKIYEVDPLICPKCAGPMRVIAFIEQAEVIRKILEHLGLWKTRHPVRPPSHAPPATGHDGCGDSWMPSADDYLTDPVYPADAYL